MLKAVSRAPPGFASSETMPIWFACSAEMGVPERIIFIACNVLRVAMLAGPASYICVQAQPSKEKTIAHISTCSSLHFLHTRERCFSSSSSISPLRHSRYRVQLITVVCQYMLGYACFCAVHMNGIKKMQVTGDNEHIAYIRSTRVHL